MATDKRHRTSSLSAYQPSPDDAHAFLWAPDPITRPKKLLVHTHGALRHQLQACSKAMHFEQGSQLLAILRTESPLSLLNTFLIPAYHGLSVTVLDPKALVKNPAMWLGLASVEKISHIIVPDSFFFQDC